MRLACDTGGTFTDLLVEDEDRGLSMFKVATTPNDPVQGVLDAIALAAKAQGQDIEAFLNKVEMLIHGTTHAINAIVTGNTAKTAFLTTEWHPDILVLREAGRQEPFNFKVPYPRPYIPRSLTFELKERIASDGKVSHVLDEDHVVSVLETLKKRRVQAVAVCLLWSVANPAHELRVGELIEEHLPGVPYTLSHLLNPSIREYRRGSSTAIDASLKPLMGRYLGGLQKRLKGAGFKGRLLVLTSQGGMIDAADLAQMPIHAINSGPSMAPLAGKFYTQGETKSPTVIVADTGGTTYDVSLVNSGEIPVTRDMWIGEPQRGHLTGFPSVDVKSIGAGGGSIASVDKGGLLSVGPQSAGADPGPACFGKGGTDATLTDACVVAGIIDPDFFLGGAFKLSRDNAEAAIQQNVAEPLGVSAEEASWSVIELATENMVQAIGDITIHQGIDPSRAVLVGGGGAAGLNSVWIARRLGCRRVIIPDTGPALSAAGALISDLASDFQATHHTVSDSFDFGGVTKVLNGLVQKAEEFQAESGQNAISHSVKASAEVRYSNQIWEIEVPLANGKITDEADLDAFKEAFHARHEELFAYRDQSSDIEFVTWIVRTRSALSASNLGAVTYSKADHPPASHRRVYFGPDGWIDTPVITSNDMKTGEVISGPVIVETPFTIVTLDPHSSVELLEDRSLALTPFGSDADLVSASKEAANA